MDSGIYMIRFNGCKRIYIGQSISLKNRFKYHRGQLKSGKHYNSKLQRAYNKYGFDNMSISIIEYINIDKPLLNEKERYFIDLYDSFRNGLNCSDGGDSCLGKSSKKIYQYDAKNGELVAIYFGYMNTSRLTGVGESNIRQCCYGLLKTAKGFHFSLFQKTPQMVLKDIISKVYSDEYKEQMRILFTGENNPMFGKKRPDVTGDNNPYRKMIKNGYKPKRKYSEGEIIRIYKSGKTQKETAKIIGCTQACVSITLINNNISAHCRAAESNLYFL